MLILSGDALLVKKLRAEKIPDVVSLINVSSLIKIYEKLINNEN